jgi:NADP-dependent 3-hydroxy acid dehydrogenase YdfG
LLGRTVASKLAADGFTIVGVDRSAEGLRELPDRTVVGDATEVNAGAALWLTQAVAPHMEQAGSGAIVHVSARPGLEPTSGLAAYSLDRTRANARTFPSPHRPLHSTRRPFPPDRPPPDRQLRRRFRRPTGCG